MGRKLGGSHKKPSDLGYNDAGYALPGLSIKEHTVESRIDSDMLFYEANTLTEQRQARRESLERRVQMAAEIITAEPNEPWAVWCELNDESEALAKAIPGAVEVEGADSISHKENAMMGFSDGKVRILVSKPSICGFGMNFQHCARTVFVGVGHSYEMFYQAIRRFYRFGQTRPVIAHVIYSEAETPVMRNLQRKEQAAQRMSSAMVEHMRDLNQHGLKTGPSKRSDYTPQLKLTIPDWLRSDYEGA